MGDDRFVGQARFTCRDNGAAREIVGTTTPGGA
jgi:hypothetical protein